MNPRPAISEALKHFNPFKDCSIDELERLSAIATLAEYPPEVNLFEVGDTDTRDFYLLDGELRLSAKDGGHHCLVADNPTAKQALSRLRPRQYTATTQAPSRVLIIDSKQCDEVRKLSELRQETMYQVSECQDSEDLASLEVFFLLRTFKQEMARGLWHLPEMPELVPSLIEAIGSEQFPEKLAVKVCEDEATARTLLHIANTPVYQKGSACTQVLQGVERIGWEAAYLALGLSARKVLLSKAQTQHIGQQYWQQILDRGAVVWWLAQLTGIESPAKALGLSLLHNVGGILAEQFIASHPDYQEEIRQCPHIRDELHAKLSEMTLAHWGLDITITTIPCYADNWEFVLKDFKAGVGELVQMASYLVAYTMGDEKLPDITELSSFNRLILFENRLNKPETLTAEIAELLTRVRRMFEA